MTSDPDATPPRRGLFSRLFGRKPVEQAIPSPAPAEALSRVRPEPPPAPVAAASQPPAMAGEPEPKPATPAHPAEIPSAPPSSAPEPAVIAPRMAEAAMIEPPAGEPEAEARHTEPQAKHDEQPEAKQDNQGAPLGHPASEPPAPADAHEPAADEPQLMTLSEFLAPSAEPAHETATPPAAAEPPPTTAAEPAATPSEATETPSGAAPQHEPAAATAPEPSEEELTLQELRRLFNRRKFDEAVSLCESYFGARPEAKDKLGHSIHLKEMVRIELARGGAEAAKSYADRLRESVRRNDPVVDVLYARHFTDIGDLEQARAAWQRALVVNPNARVAQQNLDELNARLAAQGHPAG